IITGTIALTGATTIITVIGVGGISQEGPMRHGYALISIAAISALLTAAAPAAPSLEGDWEGSGIVSSTLGADVADCDVQYRREGERSFSYNATCIRPYGQRDQYERQPLQRDSGE